MIELTNIQNWKQDIKDAFDKIEKKLILKIIAPIDQDELNLFCRNLTVNVSYYGNLAVLGKKLDDIVFTLDDFHETNHRLDLLLKLKEQFPKLKVTLFTIPSKCSIEWLKDLKSKYDWMEFAVHGWFHDVNDQAIECPNWTKEDAHKYLKMAEDMEVFIKGFKAPGWQMNHETYEALKERGYWIMDHEQYKHIRPVDFTNYYETGHLWEINGHIQETPFNGLETIINNKNPFLPTSNFWFVSEMVNTPKNNQRLEKLCQEKDINRQ